jgi:Asp/Glu/hydantoin racemase
MAEAVAAGSRVGVIATNKATMSDAEHYLKVAAQEAGREVVVKQRLAADLIQVLRDKGHQAFEKRLEQETLTLSTEADVVLLSQFSFATALDHLRKISPVPVLSAPHSSARRLKKMLEA